MTDPFIGCVFKDAYRIEAKIGEGGFGTVYTAVQLVVDRHVAVKVLRPDRLAHNPELRELLIKRFQREAMATSKLMHPNTVRLIDFGSTDDDVLFLVLELLQGEELQEAIVRDSPMAPARAARIGQQVCQSLAEAHGRGIIHRDLKPANIFLCGYEGTQDFVKVMDFGIARVVAADSAQAQLTRTGTVQGTPKYMAPEQAMAMETSAATDLYSLGCILYEMLTGGPVFDADTLLAISLAHVQKPPPPLVMPGVPDDLVAAWNRCLQQVLDKDPLARPQSGGEMAAMLRELESMSTAARIVRPEVITGHEATLDGRPGSTPALAALDIGLPGAPSPAAGTPAAARPAALMPRPTPLGSSAQSMETMGAGLTDLRLPPGPPWKLLGAVLAAVAVLGVGLWFAFGRGDSGASEGAEAELTQPAAQTAPATRAATGEAVGAGTAGASAKAGGGEGAPSEVVSPIDPTMARLTLRTEPPEVEVWRGHGFDAVKVCITPCEAVDIEAGRGEELLKLRLAGYKEATVSASLDAGALFEATVTMEAEPDKAAPGQFVVEAPEPVEAAPPTAEEAAATASAIRRAAAADKAAAKARAAKATADRAAARQASERAAAKAATERAAKEASERAAAKAAAKAEAEAKAKAAAEARAARESETAKSRPKLPGFRDSTPTKAKKTLPGLRLDDGK